MTGHYGPEEWWYPDGTSAANVSAVVFEGDQSTLAAIYTDAGLTVPLANPTTTDGSGMLEFYAADGNYWIFVGDENYGDSVLANLSPPVTGTGGALLISNNLSDLSNVITARSNLGLGTAALADTGTGPTNVILGNDARLTDARTPTAHAATHGALGSDPVTIAESQVTNLATDLAGKQPIDSDLTAIAALTPANDDIIQRKAGVWTNRTIAQYKVDQGYTPAEIGAVPTTRLLTAGAALSGGGDLSADRTFDVDLGTTAGTAAEGNDARIVGAQQRSTLTTKGDLYVATAAATTTRQPVGTDGQVLIASSVTGTGLDWATVGSDPNAQSRLVIDAKGDLYAGTGNDATTRLPVGVDGQALRANSATGTGLEWDTLTAGDVGADPAGSAAAAQAASQPLDSDLTAIAGLTPSNDDVIQRKAGVWVARTMAQVKSDLAITSADVGAQPIATIDAKGDLYAGTADNTTTRLPVGADGLVLTAASAQGTGLLWAAATDAGAIPKSTVTTKGDLIVATASATVTRRGVGTNGQVLTADSTQADGVKWATPASSGALPGAIVPRAAFIQAGGVATTRSSKTATLNVMFLVPICLLSAATLSTITFEVSSSVGSALVRLGVYAADASTYLPTGSPVADFGTFTADTASTAGRACVVSQALPVGVSWIAIVGQSVAPTLRHCAGFTPFVSSAAFPGGTGTGWNNSYAQTGVSGALPSIGSIADSDSPLLGLKF